MTSAVERLQSDLDSVLALTEEEFEDASTLTALLGVVTQMRSNIAKAEKWSLTYLTVQQVNEWRQSAVAFIKDALGVELTDWELPERTSPDVERQTRDLGKLRDLLASAVTDKDVKEVRALFRLIKAAEINLQTASLASGIYLTQEAALAAAAAWFDATQQIPEVAAAVKAMRDDLAQRERFGKHLDQFMGTNR
jgi:hypothetical protein